MNPRFKNSQPLTAAYLREVFSYDAATGVFTRIKKTGESCEVGDIGGCLDDHGYLGIRIAGKLVRNHRLAWLYMTGEFPKLSIDHINGIRTDNRWENLREANDFQQQQNVGRRRVNTSGHPGVSFHKGSKKWRAYISVNHKQHSLGYFETCEEASAAYIAAKKRLHSFQPEVRATSNPLTTRPIEKRDYRVSQETAAKIAAIKRQQFANGSIARDERGCFVGKSK